ncbi:MAG: DUF2798 domain-containing protein, partial [Pseudomonadota bacterium]
MKLPAVTEPYVYGALLSCLMCVITTGIATLVAIGLTSAVLATWLSSWFAAWLIAFPSVLIVAPIVRRLTSRIVATP